MAPRCLQLCFAFCRSIPVVFITAVIVWSYYAYVVQMCFFSIQSIPEKLFYLLLYHPLLVMMLWSYWQTIFTPIAVTPKQFYLSRVDLERFDHEVDTANRKEILLQAARNLPAQCRTIGGEMRYCEKCKAIKPDRAHHCSVCGRCVLKMDHHCPWVNNCVCFSNYKFFVLFLGYALAYCLYVVFTSLQYFISFWRSIGSGSGSANMNNLHVVFLFFAGAMFSISLLTLFSYHCYLVSKNRSTLEAFQTPVFPGGRDKNGFNLGCRRNFRQIFGDNQRLWFLPIRTALGDGLAYPVRMGDEDHDSLLGQRQRWAEEGDTEEETVYFDNRAITSEKS